MRSWKKESNDDNKSTAMHVGNQACVTKLIAMSLSQEIWRSVREWLIRTVPSSWVPHLIEGSPFGSILASLCSACLLPLKLEVSCLLSENPSLFTSLALSVLPLVWAPPLTLKLCGQSTNHPLFLYDRGQTEPCPLSHEICCQNFDFEYSMSIAWCPCYNKLIYHSYPQRIYNVASLPVSPLLCIFI